LKKSLLLVVLALCGFTSGCWESQGSLYGDTKAIQPFRPGKILASSRDQPGKVSHFVLTKEANGTYRLTNADKGTDFGDAMVLRFFALAGVPKDLLVSEAVSDDKCKPGDICHPVTAASARMYGLVRLTKDGAEISIPDCDKSSAVAKLTGVEAGNLGICTFRSRAVLETALRIQAKRIWKPDVTYRYE
jgi:hypothetical protein